MLGSKSPTFKDWNQLLFVSEMRIMNAHPTTSRGSGIFRDGVLLVKLSY